MDQFANQLRAVTEDPPPTSIDIDRLITGEYRRRRRVQYTLGGGAVAAITALVLAVPTVFAGGANSPPPGGPPMGAGCRTENQPGTQQSHSAPRPTEPCADAIVRLQNVLFEVIESVSPGLVKAEDVTFQGTGREVEAQWTEGKVFETVVEEEMVCSIDMTPYVPPLHVRIGRWWKNARVRLRNMFRPKRDRKPTYIFVNSPPNGWAKHKETVTVTTYGLRWGAELDHLFFPKPL